MNSESQIRQLLERSVRAIRAKDAVNATAHYAPDVLVFDLAPPLEHRGPEVARKNAEAWFATWQGPIDYQMKDLVVRAGETFATAHAYCRAAGTKTSGARIDMWFRWSTELELRGYEWLVVFEHLSVPFDMTTLKACFDLEPGGGLAAA